MNTTFVGCVITNCASHLFRKREINHIGGRLETIVGYRVTRHDVNIYGNRTKSLCIL